VLVLKAMDTNKRDAKLSLCIVLIFSYALVLLKQNC